MGDPIFQPFFFTTREYYDGATGNDVSKGSTLTFQELDETLLYLSASIADGGISFIGLTTASANLNTINFSKSDGTNFSILIDTGSGQTYTAGPGINIDVNNYISASLGNGLYFNGNVIEPRLGDGLYLNGNLLQPRLGDGLEFNGAYIQAKVRTVNGIGPINGNIATTLTAVLTGNSASLITSSSGAITGSIAEGTVWVISNDPDPDKNGDAYIFDSGSVG